MDDSNIGEVGVKSIRLAGKKIENLPPHQSAVALQQIPAAKALELENEIKGILASYPRVTQEYLQSRIREAEQSKADFLRTKVETKGKIKELRMLVKQASERKTISDIQPELEAIRVDDSMSFEEKKAKVQELMAGTGLYSVDGLYDQVDLFEENIVRLDQAIEQETESIAELREVLAQITIRDKQLKALGVTEIQ